MAGLRLLGGLTPRQFLARHWQKRALLVRGAFPGWRDPLTPDELAGLACEADVESRLVMERGARRPWTVFHGPQSQGRLRRLPPSHWTLLVQDVDKHLPQVAALLDPFAFLPHWRVDDVMISFAPPSGSVGAHVDSYDVFLIQGRGRRRWRIDTRAPADFRPGLDLRILKRFRAEAEWVLEPGDMLYLPPGVAHHGIALEDCLTYSVGLRAPRQSDLLLACLKQAADTGDHERYFEDPWLAPQRHAGEISPSALRRLRALARQAQALALRDGFARVVGELLTEPKGEAPRPSARRMRAQEIAARVRSGAVLARAAASRLAFIRRGRAALLFVDGRTWELPADLAFAAALLTDRRRVAAEALRPHLAKPRFVELLRDLIEAGALELVRVQSVSGGPVARR